MRQRMRGRLHQQRIIVRRDDRAGVCRAGIQPNAEAAAAAVSDNFTRIREEMIFRIFRCDPALNGIAVMLDFILFGNSDFRIGEIVSFRNHNLRLNDVDIRDHFRHGMLDLDTRIDFDEIKFTFGRDQKFYRTRIDVIDIFHQPHGRFANLLTQLQRQREGRSDFHHFLVAALDRAVTFKQMHDITFVVA